METPTRPTPTVTNDLKPPRIESFQSAPPATPPPTSVLYLSFGGGYRVANLLFFPVIFAVLAFFVDRALVRRVNKENHRTFQFLRALPHVLYGIVTCVIFVPDWIRAGWLRASASIAIVLYVKLAVSAFYTSVTSHVLQRLQTRSVVRDAQTDAK
eukprot:jgi/Mesvir1/10403/Mv02364-RA.1